MQKKPLAVAITGLLSISSVQATPLYDQDGTKLIFTAVSPWVLQAGGSGFDSAGNKVDDGAEFVDVYSR